MIMIPLYNKRWYSFLTLVAFLILAFIFTTQSNKWKYSAELSPIPILMVEDEKVQVNGDKRSDSVGNSQMEDEGEWEIVYDEMKLSAEVDRIHDSNYKVKEGDSCFKSVPDCVIVGVAKCGTRELTDFMSIHPNIVSKHQHGLYQIASPNFANNLTAHTRIKNAMPCKYSDQISVLKADGFLISASKPRELFRLNPNMKIIAIIREPISRLISHLSFNPTKRTREGIQDDVTMNTWLTQHTNNLSSRQPRFVELSTYDVGLERYVNTFKRENILVIESNEF